MSFERMKSIILSILVITSCTLVFMLWTYKAEYKIIEESNYVPDASISNKKVDITDIVRPSKIIFHKNDKHYATVATVDISQFLKKSKEWTFQDFKDISSTVLQEQYLNFVHGNNQLEIIFNSTFPLMTYRDNWKLKGDDNLNTISFDRIVIPLENNDDDTVYFIDYIDQIIFKARAKNMNITELLTTFNTKLIDDNLYVMEQITQTNALFFPKKEVHLNRSQYYINNLDPEQFKNVLFSNPNFVKKSDIATGEQYTDGSSIMNVDTEQKTLTYMNTVTKSSSSLYNPTLLLKSFQNINEYGGWTDNYRFDRLSQTEQRTIFQLYRTTYPVFNYSGMTEISQSWSDNHLSNYEHPLFTLKISDRVEEPVTLKNGETILKGLKQNPTFNISLLNNMVIGYKLDIAAKSQQIVILEPSWFCLYDGTWKEVQTINQEGGMIFGLE